MLRKLLPLAISTALLTASCAYADDTDTSAVNNDSNVVFRPASMFNGNFYVGVNGAYDLQFLHLSNPTGLDLNHASQRLNDFAMDGEIGYAFDKDYFAPIRIGFDTIYRLSKKISMNPITVGSANYGDGSVQDTEFLGNVYYDFHTSDNFTPYVGLGAGIARNNGQLNIRSLSTTNIVYGNVTQTSSHFAWDAILGVDANLVQHLDGNLFVRFNDLGSAKFAINDGTATQVYATTNHFYAIDIGLGLRYNFV